MALKYSENGTNDVVPVVLLHAFPLNRNFWNAQLKGLGDVAHVYAPDLPGFGDSPALTTENPSISDYARSMFKFMDDVGLKKAVIGGCSMGGYIMFEMWKQDPSRIGGLMFLNTRCEPDSEEGKAGRYKANETVQKEGTKPMSEAMIGRVFSQKMIPLRQDAVNQVKQWILAAPPQGVIHGNIAMATRGDSTPILSTINVPTLVLSGTEDPITGEAIMKPMKEGIKGNKYVAIQDAGHLSPVDSPQEVTKAMRDFLDEKVKQQFQSKM